MVFCYEVKHRPGWFCEIDAGWRSRGKASTAAPALGRLAPSSRLTGTSRGAAREGSPHHLARWRAAQEGLARALFPGAWAISNLIHGLSRGPGRMASFYSLFSRCFGKHAAMGRPVSHLRPSAAARRRRSHAPLHGSRWSLRLPRKARVASRTPQAAHRRAAALKLTQGTTGDDSTACARQHGFQDQGFSSQH